MFDYSDIKLTVIWPDGLTHAFHPLWLRERSFDASNKDATTGHRIVEAAFFPSDIALTNAVESGDGIALTFSDGHACQYSYADLRHQTECPLPVDLTGEKQLWDATLDPLPRHAGNQALSDDDALTDIIDDIARYGFVLLSNAGDGEDDLGRLCDRIGPIRPTNWGTIADIKSIADAYDLSMTGRALEPHVDNPYRLPGPGYIFLHCLESAATGGDSFLIDGFNVAQKIRARNPEAFQILSATDVGFHYADGDAILDHYGPLIELNKDGSLHRVRFHNRADQVPAYSVEELSKYYAARRLMADEVWSDNNTIRFRLDPGDVLIVDNYRLFHGRTEIDMASGNRFLRQCYMDRDAVSSRQKLLLKAKSEDGTAS